MIRAYIAETREECGAEHDQGWSFPQRPHQIGRGQHQIAKRAHLALCTILRYQLRGNPRWAAVQTI